MILFEFKSLRLTPKAFLIIEVYLGIVYIRALHKRIEAQLNYNIYVEMVHTMEEFWAYSIVAGETGHNMAAGLNLK